MRQPIGKAYGKARMKRILSITLAVIMVLGLLFSTLLGVINIILGGRMFN